MDIMIGGTTRVGPGGGRGRPDTETALVEAKLLDIRSPRKRRGNPPNGTERREQAQSGDPADGRVVVLLIPEGQKVPRGVESGQYRIFLRFVPRYPAR